MCPPTKPPVAGADGKNKTAGLRQGEPARMEGEGVRDWGMEEGEGAGTTTLRETTVAHHNSQAVWSGEAPSPPAPHPLRPPPGRGVADGRSLRVCGRRVTVRRARVRRRPHPPALDNPPTDAARRAAAWIDGGDWAHRTRRAQCQAAGGRANPPLSAPHLPPRLPHSSATPPRQTSATGPPAPLPGCRPPHAATDLGAWGGTEGEKGGRPRSAAYKNSPSPPPGTLVRQGWRRQRQLPQASGSGGRAPPPAQCRRSAGQANPCAGPDFLLGRSSAGAKLC